MIIALSSPKPNPQLVEDVNPYKPILNPVSIELAKRKKTEKMGKNIWEHLYNMDRVMKERRDQYHLEKKLEEEEQSLQGCTFQPEIKAAGAQQSEVDLRQEGGIYERTKQWKMNIDER